jgi:hypothetical protein
MLLVCYSLTNFCLDYGHEALKYIVNESCGDLAVNA